MKETQKNDWIDLYLQFIDALQPKQSEHEYDSEYEFQEDAEYEEDWTEKNQYQDQ